MNTKYVVLAIIVIAVFIGGWYYLAPQEASAPVGASAGTKAFSLVVQDRKIVSGEAQLAVQQGDTVSITITADESDELHLHGYDLSADFETGTPATLTFTASKSGRFPFEMEGAKTELGELHVEP